MFILSPHSQRRLPDAKLSPRANSAAPFARSHSRLRAARTQIAWIAGYWTPSPEQPAKILQESHAIARSTVRPREICLMKSHPEIPQE